MTDPKSATSPAARPLTPADLIDAELARAFSPSRDEDDVVRRWFVLRAAGCLLAIPVEQIVAVLDDVDAAPVPAVPAHVLGVLAHEDRVIAAIDVARLCPCAEPIAPSGHDGFPRMVVVRAASMTVALRVSAAHGVVDVAARAHRPVADDAPAALRGYLSSQCETGWGLCGCLELERMLEDARVR